VLHMWIAGNAGPTSLGHPNKLQRISHLGNVIARHSSSGRQPKFAAFNSGLHLHSDHLAHIPVKYYFSDVMAFVIG